MVAPITEEENEKLDELRDVFLKNSSGAPFFNDGCLVRWLRANNGDVLAAKFGLRKCQTFRKAFGLDELISWKKPEVLAKYYGYGYPCCDREGSPVLLTLLGNSDFEGILKSCQSLDYLKVSMAHLEEGLAKADEIAKKKNLPYEQLVLVIDGENLSTTHYTFKPFTNSYLSLIQLFQDYYPLILKKVIVIRAPAMAQYAYSVLRPFLSQSVQDLVELPADCWKERLFEYVDPDDWPAFWGGNMKDSTGEKCLSKMTYTPGCVPEFYYFDASKDLADYTEITVYPGDRRVMEFDIQKSNSLLYWKYKTKNEDIGFGVYYDPSGESMDFSTMQPVFPYYRLECTQVPVEGSLLCEKTGKYVVEFDNYYSWFSAKELSYVLRVIES